MDACVADKDWIGDEMLKRKAQLDYARENERSERAAIAVSLHSSAAQLQHATDQLNQQNQVNQLSTAISASRPPPVYPVTPLIAAGGRPRGPP